MKKAYKRSQKSNLLWTCTVCFNSFSKIRCAVSLIILGTGVEEVEKGLVRERSGSAMILHYHKECWEKKVPFRKDRKKPQEGSDFRFDSIRRRNGVLDENEFLDF